MSLANNKGHRLTAEDVVVVPDDGPGDGPRITNVMQGANGGSFDPSLSGDGSRVAFQRNATNLIEGETEENGNVEDIFLFDLATGERTNVTAGSTDGGFDPTLSADGSTLAFSSTSINLVEDDANGRLIDLFLFNVATGERVNVTQGANSDSLAPSLSADGSKRAFQSSATNLVEGSSHCTTSWPAYGAALRQRGSLLVWFDPETEWLGASRGRRGRPATFSDAAIRTCLTLKALFGLALRQTTGLVASLLKLARLDWPVPDFEPRSAGARAG